MTLGIFALSHEVKTPAGRGNSTRVLTYGEFGDIFTTMKEIAKYKGCFVCGDENNIGLNAKFFFDGEKAVSEITADEKYAGYKHIFHGGIIATMLDEIMIKALLAEDLFVVTAEMTVRFKRPVYSGDKIQFEGYKTAIKGPVFFTEGRAVNQNGEIVAEATGKYIRPKSDLSEQLKESVEP